MKKRLLIFTGVFFVVSFGWSQQPLNQPHIFFEHFLLPGSLYFNPINDIAQDSSGLMWFASDNGVYRYDGYELINSHDRENLQQFRGYQVNAVIPGPKNFIYAALKQRGGIVKFKNDFSQYTSYTDILKGYEVHDIFYFEGKIGFLSKGRGLFILDEALDSIIPIKNQYPVYSFCQSGDKIAAGSFSKIILYDNLDEQKVIDLPEINDQIKNLQRIGSEIYFSTKKEVYRLDINTGKAEYLYGPEHLHNADINAIYKSNDGGLWILTDWNGLFFINENQNILHFEKSYYQNGALSNNRTFSILESENGVIWIATGAGMNKYDKNKRYFSHLSHNPADANTISGDIVRGIYENSNEEILVGTDDGVINIINSARTAITRIPIKVHGTEKIVPFSFLETSAGKEYFIGTSEGLFHYNVPKNNFTFINSPHNPEDKRVRQLINYDADYIIGLSRGMVWKMNKHTKEINGFSVPQDKKGLLNRLARTVLVDDDKSIYVGCKGALAFYNPRTKEFHSRTIATISSEGDTTRHMVLYLERYENKLFIGTFQGGLFILDLGEKGLKGKLTHFNENSGLPDNTVYAALRDKKGFYWISSNNGLSRFDIENQVFKNYDRSNGLQGEEFNRLAYLITKRGEFLFGGIEGLNIFFPEKLDIMPSVKIRPILVGVEIINQFDGEGKRVHPRYSLINEDKLELDYNQNYLTFRFASNNYSQTEKNRFYYRLENYDKNWIYSNDRTATYTGLKPGNYNFKVKAVNPEGEISTAEASMPIEITTLWWRTWWAGLLVGLSFIGFIAYSFRKNVKKNNAIKKLLETEIQRRTSELKESKEELARLNSKKDFIFSILSHDLRSPLTTLKGFLGILVDHFDSLNEDEIKTHAVNIKNSVAKSLDLLDNTLYWSLSQMGEIAYTPTRVSLNVLFEKMYGLYDLTARKKKVNLVISYDEEIEIYADENMTYITLRNLLSNAIKFTPAGNNVYVKASRSGENVKIVIQDEGFGIKPEDLSKLFDQSQHFMQKGTSNEKGTGLGLTLCKKFTDMNNGTIAVESKENAGTRFIVTLPVYNEALVNGPTVHS